MLIYPKDYVVPEPEPPVVLSEAQRDALKAKMNQFLTNQNKPFEVKEIVEIGQEWLGNNYPNVHISDDTIAELAREVGAENFPTVIFPDAGDPELP